MSLIRKTMPEAIRKDWPIGINFTKEDFFRIERAARAHGKKQTAVFCREIILAELERIDGVDVE